MGLSSKKTKTKSTETIGPSALSLPHVTDAASTLRPGYEDSLAASRKYQPHLDSAAGYYGDVMGGKYLNSNPYTDDIVRASNEDAMDSLNTAFMPRFGSGYHAKTVMREIANNSARIRGGAYDQERAYQNEAGRNLAGVATTATALPMLPAQGYSDAVGGLMGRYMTGNSSSVSKSTPSLLSQMAKAAQVAAMVASDRRLKTDIEKLGEESDGLGIYEYRYVTDDAEAPVRTGVMADEVARLRPWALGPERNGFATVDYSKLESR